MHDLTEKTAKWIDHDFFKLHRSDLQRPIKAMYVIHQSSGRKIAIPGYAKLFTQKELRDLGFYIEPPETDYYNWHNLNPYTRSAMREFLRPV